MCKPCSTGVSTPSSNSRHSLWRQKSPSVIPVELIKCELKDWNYGQNNVAMVHWARAREGSSATLFVCVFMLRRAMVLKRAALLGMRGFNYRLWKDVCVWGGKQGELNGLLVDKMKESDNEDWAETWENSFLPCGVEDAVKETRKRGEDGDEQ